jgi:rhodanese-related sulfurtransferase
MVVDAADPQEGEAMTRPHLSLLRFQASGLALAFVLFLGPVGRSSTSTEQAASLTPGQDKELSGGPYCGIYSVYTALRCLHHDVDFEGLVNDKYIGSPAGSSLVELRKAVEDFGAHAQAVEGLTASSLRMAESPIILHVRQPGFDSPYAHWVLFLGMEGDKARIVDPPNEVEPLSIDQVMAMSDGTGLAVAEGTPNVWIMSAASWAENGAVLLGAFLAVGAVNILFSRWRKSASGGRHGPLAAVALGASRMLALVVVAGLVGIAWRLWCSNGRVYAPDALALVVERHFHAALPTASLADVESAVNNADVLFIDARLPRDYEWAHIPGAVNYPISAGWVDSSRLLAGIPHDRRVIVYCQSESCTWSTEVGSDIAFRGFTDVSVFHGGWVEWYQHEHAQHGT